MQLHICLFFKFIYAFILGGVTNIIVGEAMTSDDIPTPEDFGQQRRQRDRNSMHKCLSNKRKNY